GRGGHAGSCHSMSTHIPRTVKGFSANPLAEVSQRPPQTLLPAHAWLPAEQRLRTADVGTPYLGVILRERLMDDRVGTAQQSEDLAGEFHDRYLVRIAEVDRIVVVGEQEALDAINQIVHVAEAARLPAVAIDAQRFAPKRLPHEVR